MKTARVVALSASMVVAATAFAEMPKARTVSGAKFDNEYRNYV